MPAISSLPARSSSTTTIGRARSACRWLRPAGRSAALRSCRTVGRAHLWPGIGNLHAEVLLGLEMAWRLRRGDPVGTRPATIAAPGSRLGYSGGLVGGLAETR